MSQSLKLVGFASGIAANNPDCALGPWYLYYHPEIFQRLSLSASWSKIIKTTSALRGTDVATLVEDNLKELSAAVLPMAEQRQAFCVIGGDHSSAIGTWSAVAHAQRAQGDIGLIWIDAHMDSHTPQTSLTQNIHGMPVAHLLGHGRQGLSRILDDQPKLKPQHIALIGIRSYETAEQQFLENLGIKIYYMQEVLDRGIGTVLTEAYQHVSAGVCGVGVSIDMDAIDPKDAPGVGCPEAGGIRGDALLKALRLLPKQSLLGLEITEYNPIRDVSATTAELLVDLIEAVYGL